jgi:NitT/TauT family transport system substrate-binding protein
MPLTQIRRRFLTTLPAASAAGVIGVPRALAAEPPPEVTTVPLAKVPAICIAPYLVREELLRDEGFTNVRYVDVAIEAPPEGPSRQARELARG